MQVETIISLSTPGRDIIGSAIPDADLVLYFLSPDYPAKEEYFHALRAAYPKARLLGCTTGGEIAEGEALEQSAVCAAVKLGTSSLQVARQAITDIASSRDVGTALGRALAMPDLRLVFLLSDGLGVNGSELVQGVIGEVGESVIVTGGLAADGARFLTTGVGVDGLPQSGSVAAVGFSGKKLQAFTGSMGGWIRFGPERLITRAAGKVLYALDGKPALDLYRKYLGEEAANLPGSGLLFPLSVCPAGEPGHNVVRTIVGIDEKEHSLIFAGDMKQGYTAQLMRGDIDNLLDGAEQAADRAMAGFPNQERIAGEPLGILVSCIGRKLLMGQQISAEVEAVKRKCGDIPLIGFYSYGEISPHPETRKCSLHNQTMTITLLAELL